MRGFFHHYEDILPQHDLQRWSSSNSCQSQKNVTQNPSTVRNFKELLKPLLPTRPPKEASFFEMCCLHIINGQEADPRRTK